MRQFLFLVLFISLETCFAQDNKTIYNDAVRLFDSENYLDAIEKFRLAKQNFRSDQNIIQILKCAAYITQIQSLQGDYKKAIKNCDKALSYFKNSSFSNDSLFSLFLSNKALAQRSLGDFEKANQTVGVLLNNVSSNINLANAYQTKSRIQIDLGEYDNAISSAKKAIILNADQNDARKAALLNIIGVGFYFKEDLDSTLYYYDISYKLKLKIKADHYDLAIATYNIGIVQEDLGDYDTAIEYYTKAAQHDLLDRGESVGFISDIYLALCNTYVKKNDFEKAEEFAEKALQFAVLKYGSKSPQTAFVYQSYSNIFKLKGNYLKTLEYDKKALGIFRNTYGDIHRWTADALISVAETQTNLNQFQNANKNYQEAINIAERLDNELIIAYAEMGRAEIFLEELDLSKAKNSIDSSKLKILSVFNEQHETYLALLGLEAEYFFKQNNQNLALKSLENIKNKTKERNLFYHLDALQLELEIANSNFEDNQDLSLMKEIIDDTDNTINLILKIRKEYITNKSKIYVNNSMSSFISEAIDAAFILYKQFNNFNYLENAFKLTELNKSSTLISGIQGLQFKKIANIPEPLLKYENALEHKLANLKKNIYYEQNSKDPDSLYLAELLSEQLQVRKSLDSFLVRLEETFPEYYQLKNEAKSIDLVSFQKSIINNDETIIEYTSGKNNLYCFVISKSAMDFVKLSSTDKVKSLMERSKRLLSNQKDVTNQLNQLYYILLGKLSFNSSRLIIIPDKYLYQLPFEIFIENGKYLVESNIISYSGSVNLFQYQRLSNKNYNKSTSWSGFAPSFLKGDMLFANAEEVRRIAKIMNGKMFTAQDATLDNFKSEIEKTSIIHLATHAEVNQDNPLYTKLVFAKDSILTASDIYSLSLKADMTVLRACETGFGKLEESEGVMSMSRAFQYAGSKSTVTSLWKVPDRESSELMISFYEYLKNGMDKDKALRQAKIDYLSNTEDEFLKHPFYWAGFVLSGDNSPILEKNEIWVWTSIIVIILFTAIIFFTSKYLKKRHL